MGNECRLLASENARLLCIQAEMKDELLKLRTIKATIECIFDRKIEIEEDTSMINKQLVKLKGDSFCWESEDSED